MGFGQPVPVQYSAPEQVTATLFFWLFSEMSCCLPLFFFLYLQVTDTCCYGGLEAGFSRLKKHGNTASV